MSHRGRLILMILAALVLIPASFKLAVNMPTFGAHPLPYGDAINDLAPKERKVTNAVTAVNFDYRGFDTLGEEFMLLCRRHRRHRAAACAARGERGSQRVSPARIAEPAASSRAPVRRRGDRSVACLRRR